MDRSRRYDYVIVGDGSAGCIMAARLGEIADARILLIEAGPPDVSPDIHRLVSFYKMTSGALTWGYQTAPSPQREGQVVPLAQARVLSGGSSINAMVFTRGNPKDYDAWASEEGCGGWAFEDVLPYFRRAEDNNRLADAYHGTGGPLAASDLISPHPLSRAFVRAAQQAGLQHNGDFNGAEQEGAGLYQVTQRDGRRCSAAVAYLRPAVRRGNIDVVTDALAHRLIVEKGRAVGVRYFANGALADVRAEQEVIVAAGAIGSPKLLLLSGIGPADELRVVGVQSLHDLPGAGLEAGVPPVPGGYGCTINSCHLRPRGSVTLRSPDPLIPPEIDPNYWAEAYDFEMSLRGLEMTRQIAHQSCASCSVPWCGLTDQCWIVLAVSSIVE
ncbi:MAG: GMC family oxidoreductase N-terminal domain-containing protein [Alphaproteobacteria bacterium]